MLGCVILIQLKRIPRFRRLHKSNFTDLRHLPEKTNNNQIQYINQYTATDNAKNSERIQH